MAAIICAGNCANCDQSGWVTTTRTTFDTDSTDCTGECVLTCPDNRWNTETNTSGYEVESIEEYIPESKKEKIKYKNNFKKRVKIDHLVHNKNIQIPRARSNL